MNTQVSDTSDLVVLNMSDFQGNALDQQKTGNFADSYSTAKSPVRNMSTVEIVDMEKIRTKKPYKPVKAKMSAITPADFNNIKHKPLNSELAQESSKEQLIYHLLSLSFLPLLDFLDQAAQAITDLDYLNVQRACAIFLTRPNSERPMMDLVCSYNLPNEVKQQCSHVTYGTCFCGETAETGIPRFIFNIEYAGNFRCPNKTQSGSYHIPLKQDEKVLGVMTLYLLPGHKQCIHEQEFLTKIANIIVAGVLRHRAEQEATRLIYHNQTTNLPNRLKFTEHLQSLIVSGASTQNQKAVLYFNIDRFNAINDLFSHSTGDVVLLQVAQTLQNICSEHDLPAYLGGDEFAIALTAKSQRNDEIAKRAEQLFEHIAAACTKGFTIEGRLIKVNLSAGLLVLSDQEQSIDDCLKKAKIALADAKKMDGNSLCHFNQETQQRFQQNLTLEQNLRQALLNNEMTLFYQPQFNDRKQIIAAEALLRWESENGLIMPGTFLTLAEETGIIIDLGYWAVKEVCKKIVRWSNHQTLDHIAVNVSAKQFELAGFVEDIDRILEETGADPKKLMLELTESILVDHSGDVHKKIAQLKTRGIKISIDDFGTGYSSLAYLKHFAIDQIKIDKGFINKIDTEIKDQVIVKAVTEIANSIHSDLIAEGVESKTQFDYLRDKGCTQYQGYYFEKPIPADQFHRKYLN